MIISIYFCCLGLASLASTSRETLMRVELFGGNLRRLCPGFDICEISLINETNVPTNLGTYKSCCKACSCAVYCSIDTCCFNKIDVDVTDSFPNKTRDQSASTNRTFTTAGFRRDDSNTREAPRSTNITYIGDVSTTETVFKPNEIFKVCTDPIVYGPDYKQRRNKYFQAYYIVMNPPAAGCKYPAEDGNKACVPVDPNAWRNSLLPVFSANKNLIYVNPVCAKCHGVGEHEFEVWRVKFVDIHQNSKPDDIYRSIEIMLSQKRLPPLTAIQFFPPEDHIDLLESEKCYLDLLSVCDENFKIPSFMNMTGKEIVNACENGPRSPFNEPGDGPRTFYNVYCYICAYDTLEKLLCPANSPGVSHGTGGPSFTALLDTAFIEEFFRPEDGIILKKHVACRKKETVYRNESAEPECRLLMCPNAHARRRDGSCRLYSEQGFSLPYLVVYQMMANRSIPMDHLTGINFEQFSEKTRICPPGWEENIFYRISDLIDESTEDKESVQELGAVCVGPRVIRLGEVLSNLADTIERPLLVKIAGIEHAFDINFNKHAKFSPKGKSSAWDFKVNVPDSLDNEPNAFYKVISKSIFFMPIVKFVLTKLYLCDQIAIFPDEYNLFKEGTTAAILHNGKTYFSGEFSLETRENGTTVAKICVDDSDFTSKSVDELLSDAGDLNTPGCLVVIGVILYSISKWVETRHTML